jgi:hypothetical protein
MTSRVVEDETYISHVADKLERHGLSQLALIGLEVGRPFSFFVGQFMWVLQPALSLTTIGDELGKMAQLMEDPIALNRLIDLLESKGKA